MKHFSFKLIIAFLMFVISLGIVTFWFFNQSEITHENLPEISDCIPQYDENIDIDKYGNKDEAKLFARFRELPLNRQPTCVDESYRLTWIPTFHSPTVIRFWRSGDKHFIVTKRLDGKGGYGLGNYNGEIFYQLTANEWNDFTDLINQDSFWNMPSRIEEPKPNDGAAWMLEGNAKGNYHFVSRISPSKELNEIFRRLFKLSKVETEYELYLS